jgi:hypothetical protein
MHYSGVGPIVENLNAARLLFWRLWRRPSDQNERGGVSQTPIRVIKHLDTLTFSKIADKKDVLRRKMFDDWV